MVDVARYLGAAALVLGAFFSLVAAIGVLRLPDLFTRMHAASKAGAVGGGLILLAVALVCFEAGIAVRAVLGIAFLLLTTPVAAHLLARVSYVHKENMPVDDRVVETQSNKQIPPAT